QAGDKQFYGSSSDWYPLGRSARLKQNRSWVVGRKDEAVFLKPGETLETFVSTDGRDPRVVGALAADEPLLYRVHLRVGLVEHRGREVPATAVIGVEVRREDIRKAEAPPG